MATPDPHVQPHPVCARRVSYAPRVGVVALVVGLFALLLAFRADGASALSTAANCALPGSAFQGGDGNQDTPSLAEQSFCTEHLLPTSSDWQTLSNPVNSPDPQAED